MLKAPEDKCNICPKSANVINKVSPSNSAEKGTNQHKREQNQEQKEKNNKSIKAKNELKKTG
jgi:hypothetical protein